jgi:hypothetical protein
MMTVLPGPSSGEWQMAQLAWKKALPRAASPIGMFCALAVAVVSPAINETTGRTNFLDEFFCIVKEISA